MLGAQATLALLLRRALLRAQALLEEVRGGINLLHPHHGLGHFQCVVPPLRGGDFSGLAKQRIQSRPAARGCRMLCDGTGAFEQRSVRRPRTLSCRLEHLAYRMLDHAAKARFGRNQMRLRAIRTHAHCLDSTRRKEHLHRGRIHRLIEALLKGFDNLGALASAVVEPRREHRGVRAARLRRDSLRGQADTTGTAGVGSAPRPLARHLRASLSAPRGGGARAQALLQSLRDAASHLFELLELLPDLGLALSEHSLQLLGLGLAAAGRAQIAAV
mmetsp:Transcript_9709/g.39994  ORF Transcript_9709/g.39994 Transcript_9709/m.39994 type:complete len:273 (+) Transcript_9709:1293-2111(+)